MVAAGKQDEAMKRMVQAAQARAQKQPPGHDWLGGVAQPMWQYGVNSAIGGATVNLGGPMFTTSGVANAANYYNASTVK